MANETLYDGPGKIYLNSKGLFPEGVNGQTKFEIVEEDLEIASGFHGRVSGQLGDLIAKISMTPFDHWGLLATLFPAIVTTPAIGSAAHSGAAAKVWALDGRLYTAVNAAITKHPDLHLGVGKALYGPIEITGIGDTTKDPGTAGFLYTLATGQADPGGAMSMSDFIREAWIGAYGSVTGFGAIEAEEEWVITSNIKYGMKKIQHLTRRSTLDSVQFMAKCRPVGPTHAQIDAALGYHAGFALGSRFKPASATDLVLTSTSGKTITLKNAYPVGAGFEFGGNRLGTGEIGFVQEMTFTAGAVNPLIVFSA